MELFMEHVKPALDELTEYAPAGAARRRVAAMARKQTQGDRQLRVTGAIHVPVADAAPAHHAGGDRRPGGRRRRGRRRDPAPPRPRPRDRPPDAGPGGLRPFLPRSSTAPTRSSTSRPAAASGMSLDERLAAVRRFDPSCAR
jgi:hypothetical protein